MVRRVISILLTMLTAILNCSEVVGMPRRIQFTNASVTEYVYSPQGAKLRTVHRTAVADLSVPVGSTLELTAATTLSADSTDYCGSFLLRNGSVDRFLFDGGYCQYPQNATPATQPSFHYYTRDHLGNNRTVVSEDGTLEQVTHYYPFGGIYGDATLNAGLQPYKYNGKELDHTHGLDWYDYGSRNYDAALAVWTSFDRDAEHYYYASPYAYVLDNPVIHIDPDGNGVLKYLKAGYKIGRRVARNGISALGQAETYVSAFSDVADGVSTLTDANASNGDKVMAVFSLASEFLPVSIGDVKDVGKVVNKVVNVVHGNSKASTKAQHAYDIIYTKTEKVTKTGVSGGRIRKDGKSSRAESQVRKWNKNEGEGTYRSEITHQEPAGEGSRDRILKYEKNRANELREKGELDPRKHQKP